MKKKISKMKGNLFQFGKTEPEIPMCRIDSIDELQSGDSICWIESVAGSPTTLKICDVEAVADGMNFTGLIALVEDSDGEAVVVEGYEGDSVFLTNERIKAERIFVIDFQKAFLSLMRFCIANPQKF